MSTVAGVQRVCDHRRGSISEHHLEGALLTHLGGLLVSKAPGMVDGGNQNVLNIVKTKNKQTNIVAKLDLILKIVANMLTQVKRLPEVHEEPMGEESSSSLVTHLDESTTSSEYPLPDTTSLPVPEFF